MTAVCRFCGYGGLRIEVTPGTVQCLSEACGETWGLSGNAVSDRDRLRRIALGRIPANTDCPHTNQCASALRGDCYRAQFQAEEYSCPVAREMEGGRAA